MVRRVSEREDVAPAVGEGYNLLIDEGIGSADSTTEPMHTSGGGAMTPGRARKDACSRLRERRHQLHLGSIAASVARKGVGEDAAQPKGLAAGRQG
jgi:hypothetical protein